jgi:toxin CcdB
MCYQFDVYRNPSGRTSEYQPYYIISMIIMMISTRLIIPLGYRNNLSGHYMHYAIN